MGDYCEIHKCDRPCQYCGQPAIINTQRVHVDVEPLKMLLSAWRRRLDVFSSSNMTGTQAATIRRCIDELEAIV